MWTIPTLVALAFFVAGGTMYAPQAGACGSSACVTEEAAFPEAPAAALPRAPHAPVQVAGPCDSSSNCATPNLCSGSGCARPAPAEEPTSPALADNNPSNARLLLTQD
jgi:hypothetical protein